MRKTALAASGFALVLTLTACGGDDGETGGNELGGNGDFQSLISDVDAKATQTQTAKFTMDLNMAGQKISTKGDLLFDGKTTNMSMTMDMMGQPMEIRVVDKVMYMKMPGMASGGKPWVAIEPGGSDPVSQQMGQQLEQMDQADPRKMLDYIKSAGTMKSSEETSLGGQPATHYVFDLDFAKIASRVSGGAGMPEEQIKQLADKVKSLPLELWINADQLPAQVVLNMTPMLEAMGMPGGKDATMTLKYTDWGADLKVEAPPAGQIGEMPSTAGTGTGAGAGG